MPLPLLPGQVNYAGVSNLIFGTNMSPDYTTQNSRNNTTIQAHIKAGGFTVMRCAVPLNSTDAYIDQTANACKNMGCLMLVILQSHGNATWNQHLVSYLGNRCNLYEFGNEPDLGNLSASQYYANWANEIPNLRTLNRNAAFIGPVLGVFANLNGYLGTWLTSCHNAGGSTMPDAVSIHIYPCTGTQSSGTCAPKATHFTNSYSQTDTLVNSIVGHSLPICLTEWNIDANFDAVGNPYIIDNTFVTTWVNSAMDNIVAAGYAMANQWDAGGGAGSASASADLVLTQAPYNTTLTYSLMVGKINQYLSSTITNIKALTSLVHSKFTTKKGLTSKADAKFSIRTRLAARARDIFKNHTSLKDLMARARATFRIVHSAEIPDYANATLTGSDGIQNLTAVDGNDTFTGIG